MARGAKAKETIGNIIIEALGDKFVQVQDKKIYANADDGGEMVQIAITLTATKNPVNAEPAKTTDSGEDYSPTELSPADRAKVEELKRMLGVID